MRHQQTAKLARWQVRLLSWSGGLLWLTGVAWLLLHHFGRTKGPFGPEAHPLEAWMLRLHGLMMVAVLLGVGGLLVAHVWQGWNYRQQRVLGVLLAAVVGVLVLTGYLLYYVGDEDLRGWISLSHWLVGLVLPVVFVSHYRRGTLRGRRLLF